MTLKRRRAPTDPLELANRKTDEEFVADYLRPGLVCPFYIFFFLFRYFLPVNSIKDASVLFSQEL